MATVDPELLAQAIRLVFKKMGLRLSARTTLALSFKSG